MFIDHKRKFVFLGIPRTGTTSVYSALRSTIHDGTYTGKHDMQPPPECADYAIVACVRNPYSREVSHYLYRHTKKDNALYPWAKKWTFKDYIDWSTQTQRPPHDFHDKPQSVHLAKVRVTYLMRFENLERMFNEWPIAQELNMTLPRRNAKLRGQPWYHYYDANTARKVAHWAKNDFVNMATT